MRGFLEELPPEGKLGKTSCHFEIELSFISYMQTLKIHFNQLPECQHYSELFFSKDACDSRNNIIFHSIN